jgi:thymidylate synthase
MINMIQEQNFHQAWWKAIQNVLTQKQPLHFGSRSEPKVAWDSTQLIELTGHAIKQVLNGEIHPMSTFKAIDSYKREFTYGYLTTYHMKKSSERFDYLYMDRLARNISSCDRVSDTDELGTTDQINYLRSMIEEQKDHKISSNYSLATTWYADFDGGYNNASPCLQIIQLRWNPGDLIDMHLIWRSRDLYNAWQANIVAIADMINRECILPNDCKLNRITDYSTSLHIYAGDLEQAKRVVPVIMPRP